MIVDCRGEGNLLYEVRPEKSQDGEKRRVQHRNILLPCATFLEKPEGFHLEKKKQEAKKQAASHKFANKASDTESSEDGFQVLTPIESRTVRKREELVGKDSVRSSTQPQYEDIQFTIEVTNNATTARQDLNKTGSRKKYRHSQDVDRIEYQCRKSQDMGIRCN